jgi:hypothetical protein
VSFHEIKLDASCGRCGTQLNRPLNASRANDGSTQSSAACPTCDTAHDLVLDERRNAWVVVAVDGQPAASMSEEEARELLAALPPVISTSATGIARILEASLVTRGADRAHIRTVIDAFLSH